MVHFGAFWCAMVRFGAFGCALLLFGVLLCALVYLALVDQGGLEFTMVRFDKLWYA